MKDELIILYNLISSLNMGDLLSLLKIKELVKNINGGENINHYLDGMIKNGFHSDDREKLLELFSRSFPDYENQGDSGDTEEVDDEFDFSSEIFQLFTVEAKDRIKEALNLTLQLEEGEFNDSDINSLFRLFHTLKGESGFLNLKKLGDLTHYIEHILDGLRHHEVKITSDLVDAILKGCDVVTEIIKSIEVCDKLYYEQIDISPVISMLEDVSHKVNELIPVNSEHRNVKDETNKESMIKVKASLIDKLVDLVGELVISENQLHEDDTEDNQGEELDLVKGITKDIQNIVMMLRTVKVESLLPNIKRVIRDTSRVLDKKVILDVEGQDLEIDRNLIEELEEPLIHIFRNAISHGIESSDLRERSGKSPVGNIKFSSRRSGSRILITIRDDGAGLHSEIIGNKALEMGLISKEELNDMDELDINRLIFKPGFSTIEDVNKVSGRGVGMDIVKSRITELRGEILVSTLPGVYTEFTLIFPLIMAIVESLIVRVHNVSYVLPITNIDETFKLHRESIHYINGKPVINLRGSFIPVIRLRNYFDFSSEALEVELVVIVHSGGKSYALIVDEILSQNEVVIKSLGSKFSDLIGISAATILPGGRVGYIVNIDELVTNDVVGSYDV